MSVIVLHEDASSPEDSCVPSAAHEPGQNDSRRICSRLLQLFFDMFATLGKASCPEELTGVHAPFVDSIAATVVQGVRKHEAW
jgi:hypothetical protein